MDGGPDDAMTRQRSTHIDVFKSLDRGKTFKGTSLKLKEKKDQPRESGRKKQHIKQIQRNQEREKIEWAMP